MERSAFVPLREEYYAYVYRPSVLFTDWFIDCPGHEERCHAASFRRCVEVCLMLSPIPLTTLALKILIYITKALFRLAKACAQAAPALAGSGIGSALGVYDEILMSARKARSARRPEKASTSPPPVQSGLKYFHTSITSPLGGFAQSSLRRRRRNLINRSWEEFAAQHVNLKYRQLSDPSEYVTCHSVSPYPKNPTVQSLIKDYLPEIYDEVMNYRRCALTPSLSMNYMDKFNKKKKIFPSVVMCGIVGIVNDYCDHLCRELFNDPDFTETYRNSLTNRSAAFLQSLPFKPEASSGYLLSKMGLKKKKDANQAAANLAEELLARKTADVSWNICEGQLFTVGSRGKVKHKMESDSARQVEARSFEILKVEQCYVMGLLNFIKKDLNGLRFGIGIGLNFFRRNADRFLRLMMANGRSHHSSSDASGWDFSLSPQCLSFAELVHKGILSRARLAEIIDQETYLLWFSIIGDLAQDNSFSNILIPPKHVFTTTQGGLKSGIYSTALDNSIIHVIMLLFMLKQNSPRDYREFFRPPSQRRLVFVTYGDDMIKTGTQEAAKEVPDSVFNDGYSFFGITLNTPKCVDWTTDLTQLQFLGYGFTQIGKDETFVPTRPTIESLKRLAHPDLFLNFKAHSKEEKEYSCSALGGHLVSGFFDNATRNFCVNALCALAHQGFNYISSKDYWAGEDPDYLEGEEDTSRFSSIITTPIHDFIKKVHRLYYLEADHVTQALERNFSEELVELSKKHLQATYPDFTKVNFDQTPDYVEIEHLSQLEGNLREKLTPRDKDRYAIKKKARHFKGFAETYGHAGLKCVEFLTSVSKQGFDLSSIKSILLIGEHPGSTLVALDHIFKDVEFWVCTLKPDADANRPLCYKAVEKGVRFNTLPDGDLRNLSPSDFKRIQPQFIWSDAYLGSSSRPSPGGSDGELNPEFHYELVKSTIEKVKLCASTLNKPVLFGIKACWMTPEFLNDLYELNRYLDFRAFFKPVFTNPHNAEWFFGGLLKKKIICTIKRANFDRIICEWLSRWGHIRLSWNRLLTSLHYLKGRKPIINGSPYQNWYREIVRERLSIFFSLPKFAPLVATIETFGRRTDISKLGAKMGMFSYLPPDYRFSLHAPDPLILISTPTKVLRTLSDWLIDRTKGEPLTYVEVGLGFGHSLIYALLHYNVHRVVGFDSLPTNCEITKENIKILSEYMDTDSKTDALISCQNYLGDDTIEKLLEIGSQNTILVLDPLWTQPDGFSIVSQSFLIRTRQIMKLSNLRMLVIKVPEASTHLDLGGPPDHILKTENYKISRWLIYDLAARRLKKREEWLNTQNLDRRGSI
eukprot:GHVN01082235.1.p1 GENE.GHVN01082235.1~~GHVN01082235.1.p1  ORF type:complete len:1318 (+),score=55.92 GHVN01082235.1:34-3987(+)